MAGLMIAAELAERRLVQLEQNLAQLLGFGIAGCETLSVNLASRAFSAAALPLSNLSEG